MTDANLGYRFLLLIVITAVNAFFASSEAALLSVRESRLREMAEDGSLGAQAALSLLSNTERMLAVVQVGVTLASLGMGWVGEETIYQYLVGLFGAVEDPLAQAVIHGASFVVAFLFLTLTLVVVGEVVPKNLAIEKADRYAVLVSPVLLLVYRISVPFVYVVEKATSLVSRVLGLQGETHGAGHTEEELKWIVNTSRRQGHLKKFESEAILRTLDLGNYSAREIMVPRNDIISASVDASLDEALQLAVENQFSRIPVYEEAPEHIIGVLYAKDLLQVWNDRRLATERRRSAPAFNLRNLLHKPLVIPETKQLNQLIDEFRTSHSHMALVVDEFGTIVGLITLEDVFEQIFGEIEDEHDVRRPPPVMEAPVLELEGTINIRDLETQHGIEVPVDAGFETLAGFLLFRLGYIPKAGEDVEYNHRKFTILEMDRNRIARVLVEKLQAPPPPPEEDAGSEA